MQTFFRYTLLLFALLHLHGIAVAQVAKRVLDASQVSEQLIIDGKLNEPAWQKASKASGFTQYRPDPGYDATQQTEVSILYDNDAVYIGAWLYDKHPDSILKQLSARDDDGGNTDEFGVTFDTYFDQQNAFEFSVTAAGVQVDEILKFDGGNPSWNAAWYSKVTINDKGWCVEMKIPYSALRFPKKTVQQWGVNFYRSIRRNREMDYWNLVKPGVSNGIAQSGILAGIHDIISPVRLALLPYVSAYAEHYSGSTAKTLNGGMDIKYGINESFTLDMTLVPDFGQTLFDNKVLNLSPIEVRYDERRYFFTEGMDLFNKNDLFYSRRVGGTPVDFYSIGNNIDSNETLVKNPATSKLYNATKISGRNKHNLGIGFFNAVAAPAFATIAYEPTDTTRTLQTAPLTNYNVIVLDQALKNNSYISFINTNVYRRNGSYNADVSALLFKFANKANTYGITGSGDVSQLYYTSKPDLGYRYYLNVGRLSGNYTWSLRTTSISDRFNPNDLGYLDRNNITYYTYEQYYNIFKPNDYFFSAYNHVGVEYFRVFNPNVFRQADIYGSHNVTFKNWLTCGLYWTLMPFDSYDYNEPRVFNRYYVYPKNYMVGGFYSSDYRKKFALDLTVTERKFSERKRNSFSWNVSPRYRFNDKLSMIYSFAVQYNTDDVGFVGSSNDSIYFGIRNMNTHTNTLDAAYIFTNKMSLKLAGRHYWSQARYSSYQYLHADGHLSEANYPVNRNVNFNSFNIFTSFVWQFKPGSEMSVVYQNSIYSSPLDPTFVNNYFTDLQHTFQAPQSNSLSVKVIYYLDYLSLKSAFRNRG